MVGVHRRRAEVVAAGPIVGRHSTRDFFFVNSCVNTVSARVQASVGDSDVMVLSGTL